jgi:hypothetical protein
MRNDSTLFRVGFVPLPMASPMTLAENPMVKTKLRGFALLRFFLVNGKLHEHKAAGQRALNGVVKR